MYGICSKLTIKRPEQRCKHTTTIMPTMNDDINNVNTRTMCEICSNLTIKTPERRCKHRTTMMPTMNDDINNLNTRTVCEICSQLTIKTPEQHWRRSGVFVFNLEQNSRKVLVFLLGDFE